MLMRTTCLVMVFATISLSMGMAESTSSDKLVKQGIWGGENVRMEVTGNGATLEFGCGSGEALEPLRLDAQGHFRVKGTFVAQGPGPSREADQDNPNATYSGVVKGDTLQLEVLIGAEKQVYTLERGKKNKLLTCK